VRTLDTNVVVRILIGDDPVQTPLAEQAFLDAIAAGGAFIPDVVLAEVGWVLRGYGLERSQRHALLHRLVRTRGVAVSMSTESSMPSPDSCREATSRITCCWPERAAMAPYRCSALINASPAMTGCRCWAEL